METQITMPEYKIGSSEYAKYSADIQGKEKERKERLDRVYCQMQTMHNVVGQANMNNIQDGSMFFNPWKFDGQIAGKVFGSEYKPEALDAVVKPALYVHVISCDDGYPTLGFAALYQRAVEEDGRVDEAISMIKQSTRPIVSHIEDNIVQYAKEQGFKTVVSPEVDTIWLQDERVRFHSLQDILDSKLNKKGEKQ